MFNDDNVDLMARCLYYSLTVSERFVGETFEVSLEKDTYSLSGKLDVVQPYTVDNEGMKINVINENGELFGHLTFKRTVAEK